LLLPLCDAVSVHVPVPFIDTTPLTSMLHTDADAGSTTIVTGNPALEMATGEYTDPRITTESIIDVKLSVCVPITTVVACCADAGT
jgi:hypothetical protein